MGVHALRLVIKIVKNKSRYFMYDLDGHLIGEYDDRGDSIREYIYLNDHPIALLRPKGNKTEMLYIHTDHLGTPKLMTNDKGQVRWEATTKPFGETDAKGKGVELPLRFPGQFGDEESNLFYNFFRNYDPNDGRYIQSDPIGIYGGLNTYLYTEGRPTRLFDRLGLSTEVCIRPFWPLPLPYARHCYVRFDQDNDDTLSFAPGGTGQDPAPEWWPRNCQETSGPQNDTCAQEKMHECTEPDYSFTGYNCCHCIEDALRECGMNIPTADWPNWPINPGPQPGEAGYEFAPGDTR